MDLKTAASKPVLRKTVLWLAGIVVGIGILGFLLAPPLVRHFAQKGLSEALHRPVTIEDISINPYAMTAAVRGFLVKEPDGSADALRFDELFVNLQAESLLRGGVVLREVRLANPYVRLVRKEDGRYNVSDLIDEFLAKPKSEGETHFSLNNIRLTGGRIEFDDRPLEQRHEVSEIEIGVPFVSNLPSYVEIDVQPAFSAKVDGTDLAVGGEAKPFKDTREATLDIRLDQLDLTKYVRYSPLPLPFKLSGGKLDTNLQVSFVQTSQGKPSLSVTGAVAVKQVVVTDRADRPVLKLQSLASAIEAIDVFGAKAALRSVTIEKPDLQLRRGTDGRLTLLDLLPKPSPAPEAKPAPDKEADVAPGTANKPAPNQAPFRFSIAEIKLNEGRIGFIDEAVAPAFASSVEPLNIVVKNLGNGPDQVASVDLDLKASGGEQVRHQASVSLAPLSAKGKIEFAGLQPANYLAYYGGMVRFKPVSGTLGMSTGFDVSIDEGAPKIMLDGLALNLADLRLRQDGEKDDFYRLVEGRVTGGRMDLAAREFSIEEVALRDSKLRVRRDKDGKLSVEKLLPASGPGGSAAKAGKSQGTQAAQQAPWAVTMRKITVAGHDVVFEDRMLPEPATLSVTAINAQVENLGTQKGAQPKFNLSARISKRGSLKVAGSAVIDPLSVKTSLDARGIEILPFQPYFADKVNITVTGGALAARGNLTLSQPSKGPLKVSYRGNAGVTGLHTVDKTNAADFLVWKSLFVDGINLASVQPLKLDIREVALSDFYSRLILNADGQLNVQQVMRKPDAEAAAGQPAAAQSVTLPTTPAPAARTEAIAPPAAAPDYKITVQKVSLQGGNVNFSDFFIKPNYTADMKELGGSIAGLSSDLGTTADVELRGKVSDAPLEILGKVNPLAGNLFLDLKAEVKGMELPQFSPYSGKYAGYAIEKGKLTVNVAYKVENRKLEAQNNVFLDQLTFGEKVDSPDATKLPVLLAVALLKNSRGEIDIRLPIGGSLDDPEFSVGGVIIQVIVNLIVKAVTAPFALLGSLFGGGEELAYAEFDFGRAAITEPVDKKLEALAKALNDRPGLKLEIAGRVDPEQDREGLKHSSMERKIKAQKHADLLKKGESVAAVEDVTVDKEEYAKYLERAYKQEKFPKPRNVIGLAKDLPAAEMEKLMLSHAQVAEDDLRLLANRRAQVVKEQLVTKGRVDQERIFLVAPRLGGEPPKDKGPASRVDFSLK